MMRRDAEQSELNDTARAARLESAREDAEAWGCPASGRSRPSPLPRHLAVLAAHTARIVGLDAVPTTCPFACLMRADPWVVEITRAAGIAADFHTPLPAVLGRDLTTADVEALDALRTARHDARESDYEIERREREGALRSRE